MIRRKKDLEEVSWEEALYFVAQKIKMYKKDEIGFTYSSQLSCEEGFTAEKFAQEVLKTKNIGTTTGFTPLDSLAQLAQKNGIKPSYNFKKEDISQAEVIFLTGTDLAISHPMLWLEVLRGVRNGTKLVIASPVEPLGSRHASLWLQMKSGSEDLLFRYLSKKILDEAELGGKDHEGFESVKRALDKLKLSKVTEETGIDEQNLLKAAELLMQGKSCFIVGAGLTQSPWEDRNMAALWNLGLLCSGQMIPLGLENNSRGVFAIKQNNVRKTNFLSQIIQGASEGKIKALYLIGSVPLDKKTRTEFLVVQDSYMSEVTERADAIFPATTFAETDGTVINVEGRIQKFLKIIPPLGEAKPDWWILSQMAKTWGKKGFDYKKSQDILKEMKKMIPAFAKISPASLEKGKTLFVKEGENGESKFLPLSSRDPVPKMDKKFPFILWTEYNLDSYRNLIMSREMKGFEIVRNSRWIKINPEDAKSRKLKDGETIFVESPAGKMKGVVKITEAVPRAMVGSNFLWSEGAEFSAARLVSCFREDSRFPLPVQIKRGK
jgi:predicted molibdopterin-dependent oxidoreductase YjgC